MSRWIAVQSVAMLVALSGALVGAAAHAAPGAPGPSGCRLKAGVHPGAVMVGEDVRVYHVIVGPQAGKAGKPPLLLAWHGFGSTLRGLVERLDIADNWPDAILVAPEGLPRTLGEGTAPRGGWQVAPGELGDRDLALFDALVPRMIERYCVDPDRVYSTGFSNGAMFTNLLGCVRGDKLAGIAPVAGKGPEAERCGGPVPVHLSHGRQDERVPFADGLASAKRWASVNGCRGEPAPPEDGCAEAARCKAPVAMCAFEGGHEWPEPLSVGILDFLKAQPVKSQTMKAKRAKGKAAKASSRDE